MCAVLPLGCVTQWLCAHARRAEVVAFVREVMAENFPGGPDTVPFHSRWRHFEPGGVDRVARVRPCLRAAARRLADGCAAAHGQMKTEWAPCDAREAARRLVDLAVVRPRACVVCAAGGAEARWRLRRRVCFWTRARAPRGGSLNRARGRCWGGRRASVYVRAMRGGGGGGGDCYRWGVAQVASIHMFVAGAFAGGGQPHEVRAIGLL